MKRIICFILATIFILSMASCENSNEPTETEAPCGNGHSFTITYTNDCETDGYKISTCSVCGFEQKEEAKATGHEWYLIKSDLYCYQDGTNTYTCAICKKEKEERTSAVGHDFINDKCKYCGSTSKPIKILDFELKYQYSDWYTIDGRAKNASPFDFSCVTIHYYALQKQGNDYIIVAQGKDTIYDMQSGSILDTGRLLSTSSKIDACKIVIEVPTFEKYEIIFYLE